MSELDPIDELITSLQVSDAPPEGWLERWSEGGRDPLVAAWNPRDLRGDDDRESRRGQAAGLPRRKVASPERMECAPGLSRAGR